VAAILLGLALLAVAAWWAIRTVLPARADAPVSSTAAASWSGPALLVSTTTRTTVEPMPAVHCRGLTQDGARCRRLVAGGALYCWQHRKAKK
jgi:hypothetical protein